MVKIKVKYGGCGICYTDEHGVARHALKTPESGPFECDEAKAAQLVSMGMAEYVGSVGVVEEEPEPQPDEQQEAHDAQQEASGEQTEEPEQEPEKSANNLDPEQLQDMTIKQLKALAADMGVDVSDCDRKADYVAALAAAEVEIDDVDDPDNDLPELTAADPE